MLIPAKPRADIATDIYRAAGHALRHAVTSDFIVIVSILRWLDTKRGTT